MTSGRQLLLKVFSGPHAGAEMTLSDGRHIIGSGDDCDVILAHSSIRPQHAALNIAGQQVRLEALGGAEVHVDGEPAVDVKLPPFQSFTLGDIELAVGPAAAAWPSRTASPQRVASPRADVSAAAAPDVPKPAAAPQSRARPRRSRSVFAPLAGLVLFAAAVLLLIALWPEASVSQTSPSGPSPRERLDVLAARQDASEQWSVREHHGRLVVEGFVPDQSRRAQLRREVEELAPAAAFRVWSMESLAESAQQSLKFRQLPYQAAAGAPGEVIVSGTSAAAPDWAKISDQLQSDVPTIARLTNSIQTVSAEVEPAPAEVVVADASPSRPLPAPQPTAVVPPPQVVEEVPLGLEIQSVSVGQNASVVLAGGERIFAGASLPSGHVVQRIESDRIVVALEGRETVVEWGER